MYRSQCLENCKVRLDKWDIDNIIRYKLLTYFNSNQFSVTSRTLWFNILLFTCMYRMYGNYHIVCYMKIAGVLFKFRSYRQQGSKITLETLVMNVKAGMLQLTITTMQVNCGYLECNSIDWKTDWINTVCSS